MIQESFAILSVSLSSVVDISTEKMFVILFVVVVVEKMFVLYCAKISNIISVVIVRT